MIHFLNESLIMQKLYEKANTKLDDIQKELSENKNWGTFDVAVRFPDLKQAKGFELAIKQSWKEIQVQIDSKYEVSFRIDGKLIPTVRTIADDLGATDFWQSNQPVLMENDWTENEQGHFTSFKDKKSGYWEKVKRDPKTNVVIEYLNSRGEHRFYDSTGKELPPKKGRKSELSESSLPAKPDSIGYAKAKKMPNGKYRLYWVGTTNEIFSGQEFNTPGEAKSYYRVQHLKQHPDSYNPGKSKDVTHQTVKETTLTERCWKGYKPVPGKKAYSPGSCKKA